MNVLQVGRSLLAAMAFFLCAVLPSAALSALPVAPITSDEPTQNVLSSAAFQTSAPVAMLVDLSSGSVLFARDTDRQIPPASMTKIMTSYVALDLVAKGELALDAATIIRPETAQKWSGRGSTMYLRAGQSVTIEELLHGVITLSGNDAAVALAEAIDGSEAAFIVRMNSTAGRLGMTNSQFATVNGWPDGGRTMVTARDLVVLAQALLRDHPQLYRQFYGQRSFLLNNFSQKNRNPLLGVVVGADGIKTGNTKDAGYCFVGSAERQGRRLVMVVAGLPSMDSRQAESTRMINWGFSHWENRIIASQGSIVGRAVLQEGNQASVSLTPLRDVVITVPHGENPEFQTVVRYDGPIKAPVQPGVAIATLVVTVAGQPPVEFPLGANEPVARGNLVHRLRFGFMALFNGKAG